jgi:predicted ribosome quality control (RQC) complex YloA/Tae2 family protein
LNDLRDLAPDAESFAEFLPEALSAHESSMAALGDLLDRQMAAEDEAAKVAAERAELARMREADEVRVREQAAKEAEATKLLEAEQAASRKRIEDAERESRLKIEEQERAARAIHDAAEAKEREAQRAIEEQQRIERDKADAVRRDEEQKAFEAERERLRLIAEAHDASALLSSFKERFGHMKQYAGVVKAINAAEAKA